MDYAWARPNLAQLAAAGKRFAGRYVGPGSSGKLLTRSEADALAAHGIAVVSLAEGTATGALSGHIRGREHAVAALVHADGCGMPDGKPIYFAVDFDATPAQLETVAAYFRGVAEILPHQQIGVYGGIRTIDYLIPRGLAAWGFQTYAWSAGRWSPHATLRQYLNGVTLAGGTVDLCRTTADDIGQWTPEGTEDMTPEQSQQLATILHAVTGIDRGDGQRIPLQVWATHLAADVATLHDKLTAITDAADAAAESGGLPVTLGADDREAIAAAVIDGVAARVGLIPTAAEVGKAVADALRDRLEA